MIIWKSFHEYFTISRLGLAQYSCHLGADGGEWSQRLFWSFLIKFWARILVIWLELKLIWWKNAATKDSIISRTMNLKIVQGANGMIISAGKWKISFKDLGQQKFNLWRYTMWSSTISRCGCECQGWCREDFILIWNMEISITQAWHFHFGSDTLPRYFWFNLLKWDRYIICNRGKLRELIVYT